MDIIASLTGMGSSLFGYIIPFMIVLTIVVFFHELGHFLVARWNGVKVDAFSVGLGPELFGFTDKHETRWKFCLLPLGGYVKFAGDANAASTPDFENNAQMDDAEKAGSFAHKRVGQRAAIVAAGPIANFILAIVIFTGLNMSVGRLVSEPLITKVQEGGAAEAAGFEVGDLILSIDGTTIESFTEVPSIVAPNPGREMDIVVKRNGEQVSINVTPRMIARDDGFGDLEEMGTLGIMSNPTKVKTKRIKSGFVDAVKRGVESPWLIIKRSVIFLKDVITGQHSVKRLGGPVRIAKASGKIATLGVVALISWTAFLSVSIGFINLFPIPPLDGGHLVFYAIEKIKGSPLGEKAQENFFKVGFLFIISFMLLVTYNDVVREVLRLS